MRYALLFLALSLCAQSMKPLRVAETAYLAAASADVASSWGRYELNPVVGRGQFWARQAVTLMGISAGAVLLTDAIGRKWPRMRKPLAVVMWVSAGTRGAVAVRNWGQR